MEARKEDSSGTVNQAELRQRGAGAPDTTGFCGRRSGNKQFFEYSETS